MASNRDKARERQARRRSEGGGPIDDPRELIREEYGESLRESQQRPQQPEAEEEYSSSDDVETYDPEYDDPDDQVLPTYSRRERREAQEEGEEGAQYDNRPRSVQFLAAVRAELSRVQWPDRQALTTLTGVVLGFVIIAGSYLGLLDYVFTQLIQLII